MKQLKVAAALAGTLVVAAAAASAPAVAADHSPVGGGLTDIAGLTGVVGKVLPGGATSSTLGGLTNPTSMLPLAQ